MRSSTLSPATGRHFTQESVGNCPPLHAETLTSEVRLIILAMNPLSLLRLADFVTTIAVNSIVLSFSFAAYRRTRMRAFAFWIAACTICIISTVGLYGYAYSRALSAEDYRTFMEFYRIGYAVQAILGAAGSIMIIRFILTKISTATSPLPNS
jgi:hypothetical protein